MADKAIVTAVKKALERSPKRNFVQTVDLSINLKDVDMSIPKNRIQEDIILPHGRGKPIKVCVIGSGEMLLKAKDVADRVVSVEELGTIADDKKQAKKMATEFEYFIAEAPLMPTIGKRLGIVLGPRGKMPKPIPPGADPKPMIDNLRRSVPVRSRDRLTFHTAVGTTDMPPEEIADNIEQIVKRLSTKLEKGTMNIRSAFVKTTMGPSEKVI
ncbi:MAG TPA: 50S ribosomal protein L1 [Methanomassiliicoccales archaeon]|nr:50S ribosomal protein L1 [Euryarchaeota archaeon]HOE52093.1 50S ribosomal protein L1 [Methanomassiliicoccales archaeon]HOO03207.1 50S ribosomal protein L1 [Methanomassiliicoccales archaeon]HPD09332.1 50S ribosomal protein L1 [Methanomassiliicoccales archaeon]HQM66968.1 50S ribosomal protein L1 [Methanomassiliicoccales archaeon]